MRGKRTHYSPKLRQYDDVLGISMPTEQHSSQTLPEKHFCEGIMENRYKTKKQSTERKCQWNAEAEMGHLTSLGEHLRRGGRKMVSHRL